jgi:hypothetical protein
MRTDAAEDLAKLIHVACRDFTLEETTHALSFVWVHLMMPLAPPEALKPALSKLICGLVDYFAATPEYKRSFGEGGSKQ